MTWTKADGLIQPGTPLFIVRSNNGLRNKQRVWACSDESSVTRARVFVTTSASEAGLNHNHCGCYIGWIVVEPGNRTIDEIDVLDSAENTIAHIRPNPENRLEAKITRVFEPGVSDPTETASGGRTEGNMYHTGAARTKAGVVGQVIYSEKNLIVWESAPQDDDPPSDSDTKRTTKTAVVKATEAAQDKLAEVAAGLFDG